MPRAAWALWGLAACAGTAQVVRVEEPQEAAAEEEGPTVTVALRLEEAPSDEATGTPFTRVLLVAISPEEGRRTVEVGTFEGACFAAPPGEDGLPRVRCWWAGFGAEVHVTRDGDELVAWRLRLDEQTPTGPPEEAARLPLPAHATLAPL